MCDTLIATKLATTNNIAVFGKNSDRPPNEGQSMVYFPAAEHPAGAKVKCTYIEIPQAARTNAVFLSKPFWMWGAEMGVNEHGLVIGNEAVYSKVPANKEPALLGMDLLRAALERASTPREAVDVITSLLEQFGQGGNCASHGNTMYYHNSFLIANGDDAWVLETVDRQWAARQVRNVYSISNCLTIGKEYDLASAEIVDLAIKKGYARSKGAFDLAADYSDLIFTTFGKGRVRRAKTTGTMEKLSGSMSVETMMAALRSHDDTPYDPGATITKMDICMHASFGPIRASQSTASLAVSLDGNTPLIFATNSSAPCTSIFKPFWMDAASSLNLGPEPTARADSSLFWAHEKLHRATLLNYAERIATYAADRDALEKKFIDGALQLHKAKAPAKERADFSNRCLAEAAAAEAEWLKRVEKVPARRSFLHSMAWNGFNQKAEIMP